ncbi:MAG TPA: DUF4383 domain-containing protein, partial [bacterium]|nr:DUF4383 domain-containing protein [bacterium]
MAKMYCQWVGVVLIVLGIAGFISPNFLSFPIGGSAVWIHLLSGVILAYLGFTGTSVKLGAQVFGVIYTLVGVLGLIGGATIPILNAPSNLQYNLVHL